MTTLKAVFWAIVTLLLLAIGIPLLLIIVPILGTMISILITVGVGLLAAIIAAIWIYDDIKNLD